MIECPIGPYCPTHDPLPRCTRHDGKHLVYRGGCVAFAERRAARLSYRTARCRDCGATVDKVLDRRTGRAASLETGTDRAHRCAALDRLAVEVIERGLDARGVERGGAPHAAGSAPRQPAGEGPASPPAPPSKRPSEPLGGIPRLGL